MKFFKLALFLLLVTIFLACENSTTSEDQAVLDAYTGTGMKVTGYLGYDDKDLYYTASNQVAIRNFQEKVLADDYNQVVRQEIVMGEPTLDPTQVNKIVFTIVEDTTAEDTDMKEEWQKCRGTFTPNPKYFADKATINAIGGEEIAFMFDAGLVPEGDSIGKLELWADREVGGDWHDYYDVLNQYKAEPEPEE